MVIIPCSHVILIKSIPSCMQKPSSASSLAVSRFESLLMLCLYVMFLIFQLCTHK